MDNRACGDVRFGTDPLGYGKGFVQQSIDDVGGSGLRGIAIGFLELAENLGLAQNHGVQTGGHRK